MRSLSQPSMVTASHSAHADAGDSQRVARGLISGSAQDVAGNDHAPRLPAASSASELFSVTAAFSVSTFRC